MINPDKVDSKELGLAAGLVFARYFLKTDHLHYGYWPRELEVDISNLATAQDYYSDFLISHIPEGVKKILDVGCGTGVLSRRLLDEGYAVQSVSPSPFLTSVAQEILDGKGHIHESTFEELELDETFDMVLFAESFQYIDLKQVFSLSKKLLDDGGHILLSDFFHRDDSPKASGLGGGHKLGDFYVKVEEAGLENVIDLDITDRTAPNMDVVRDLLDNFGNPVWKLFLYWVDSNYPKAARFLRWKYKKKIPKIEEKYFTGKRNAETFKLDKSYRLVLLRK